MKIKYFCYSILVLSLFSVNFIYSANFDLKKRDDIIKLIDIIKSIEQKTNFDEKIDVLAFVIREIDFKKACPCVKKVFFKSLNGLADLILDLNSNDLYKLESFLQLLYKRELISGSYKNQIDAVKWLLNGAIGSAPKFIKQQIIKKYQKKYCRDIFVEVGSCHPGLLIPQCSKFKRTYAIGFGEVTSKHTKERLRKFKNIQLIPGVDEKKVFAFVKQSKTPAILWIDSKNFENVMRVLNLIVKSKTKAVILIDNASYFLNGKFDELAGFINKAKPSSEVAVEYDIISIV